MDLDKFNRVELEHLLEQQQPVIEAAKAWLVLGKDPEAGVYAGDVALEAAVEALLAAEGEE